MMIKDIEQPTRRRNHDAKLLDLFELFEQGIESDINGTYGNIQSDLGINNFYELVSTPMLLARLVAAGFTPIVSGQDGYKVTWQIVLKHKKTGCIATFYDWKGGSSYGACANGHKDKTFQKDLKKIIMALVNPRFPHPYDGCVVGEIA